MARPLRIQRANGRYHITARGNERKAIYRDQRDREHFLELLAEMTERYAVNRRGSSLYFDPRAPEDSHYAEDPALRRKRDPSNYR